MFELQSRAQKAAIASHEPVELSRTLVLESDTLDNSTGLDYYRRCAIQHGVYGLAKPDQWNVCGVVTGIMKRLGIPRDSRDSVKRVLLDVLKAKEESTVFDPSHSLSRRGRKRLIEDGTDEVRIIYKLAAANMLHAHIAAAVNRFRSSRSPPKPTVSWNAVQAFIYIILTFDSMNCASE